MEATLCGTITQPELRLRFSRAALHAGTGALLSDWVRELPGRRWDQGRACWVVYALGARYKGLLSGAGFTFQSELDVPMAGLIRPLAAFVDGSTTQVVIWPRLIGFEAARRVVPVGAPWQKGKNHWLVTPADVLRGGKPIDGLQYAEGVIEAATASLTAPLRRREPATGIPQWFGLALDPYQIEGALAATGGRSLLCDAPGLGKTRCALAAAAAVGAERVVVLCPPVVLTHWARETEQSRVAAFAGSDAEIMVIRAGRKQQALPISGVVIVPDTLVASRQQLMDELVAWAPDVFIYDEAHRSKTWGSKRSLAAIAVAGAASQLRMPLTGTPIMSNPVEMAPLLEMTGHLGPVFGGWSEFSGRYARRDKFGGFRPPARQFLEELKTKLDDGIWVRRTKSEVLKDLPRKSRRAQFLDVDPSGYRKAHADVLARIDEWLDEWSDSHGGVLPRLKEQDDSSTSDMFSVPNSTDDDAVREWCATNVALITLLRKAAGLAKVPAAAEMIAEWVDSQEVTPSEDGKPIFDRPLVVWTHHREVGEAMARAVSGVHGGAGIILGGTSREQVTRLVDTFQSGTLPVLVCSIQAAGVGITLTRSSDALMVETDWTPALVEQAEARIDRRGQTRPTMITTLIAPDTLDEHIQNVLARKGRLLDVVMAGGDNQVAVAENTSNDAGSVLWGLITTRITERRQRGRRRSAAA
ncbi:MAG: SNF2-related protein [Nakamurella sp.]